MSTQLLVHNPIGYPPQVSAKPLAPRVDTLDGRTAISSIAGSTTRTSC